MPSALLCNEIVTVYISQNIKSHLYQVLYVLMEFRGLKWQHPQSISNLKTSFTFDNQTYNIHQLHQPFHLFWLMPKCSMRKFLFIELKYILSAARCQNWDSEMKPIKWRHWSMIYTLNGRRLGVLIQQFQFTRIAFMNLITRIN